MKLVYNYSTGVINMCSFRHLYFATGRPLNNAEDSTSEVSLSDNT